VKEDAPDLEKCHHKRQAVGLHPLLLQHGTSFIRLVQIAGGRRCILLTDQEVYQAIFSVHSLIIETVVMVIGAVTLICLLIDKKSNKK